MTIFWWLLDLMILVSIAVSVYWQSQITIRARYNYWSFGYGLIFFILLIGGTANDWAFIVFIAAFVLMNFVSGIGGLTPERVITNGIFYATAIRFSDLQMITLTQQALPGKRSRVVAIFTTKRNRNISLVFTQTLDTLTHQLQKILPSGVTLEVR